MLSRDILAGQKLRISTHTDVDRTVFPTNSVFWRTSDNTFWDDIEITNTSAINNNFHIYLDKPDNGSYWVKDPHEVRVVVAGEGGTFTIRNTNPGQTTNVAYGGHGSVRGGFLNLEWFGRGCGDRQGFGGKHDKLCPTRNYSYNSTGSNTYACNSTEFGGDPVPDVAKHCLVVLTPGNQPYGTMYRVRAIASSSQNTIEYLNQVYPI